MTIRLETSRLIVRTLEPRDADAWLALMDDPLVRRFLPPAPPRTHASFRVVLTERRTIEHELGIAIWALEERSTGAFVGQCGLRPVEGGPLPEVELAYHIAPAAWNKGYATEAAIAALGEGFAHAGLNRVMAVAMPGNGASLRVMEKAGMRFDGHATYFGLRDLTKYVAERPWWTPPTQAPSSPA